MNYTAARRTWIRSTLFLALILSFSQEVSATVIVGDAVLESGFFGTDYDLYLTQSIPPGEGLFLVGIDSLIGSGGHGATDGDGFDKTQQRHRKGFRRQHLDSFKRENR